MKVKDATMQAYPFIEPADDPAIKVYHPGMTMRDEFAKTAMQGLIGSSDWPESREYAGITYFEFISLMAYRMADAMLQVGND